MISTGQLDRKPTEHEAEKASASYLMSLIIVIVGLPLPILNLLATVIFFLGHRKATYFVKWHSMQALFSQLFLFFMNSYGFWWTVAIVFTSKEITSNYIAYLLTIFIVNVIEFIVTIHAAIESRKGLHVRMPVFAHFTDVFIKQ